jgi:hypothetical protein
MNHHKVAPRRGVRQLGIKASNIPLHSLCNLFFDANELICLHPASFSMIDSSLPPPTPLINLRHLAVYDVIPGLELLLDGYMLPHLQSLAGLLLPLFVTFARRVNQMKTLDTIKSLMVSDLSERLEISFSFKQWHIILDALPRLRTLLVEINNKKCPPIALADLFINYLKRTTLRPLTLFSCCIDDCDDIDNKEHFINYLNGQILANCPSAALTYISSTTLDAWM